MPLRTQTCDPRRIELFLRNRLPEDFQRDFEAHLLVCSECRERFEEQAGGTSWWTDVRRYLAENDETDMPQPRSNADLDFLEPSDNPESLGKLGSYEVMEILGRGGMGAVLKAFDAALHRPVAIKVLTAEYAAHGAARKRFAREAQAAAAVIHDHVVQVHAVDANATPPYLVMAFIPGVSLQQRIDRSGPLDVKEILRIGMQTASGLSAAHAQGLVHRDIKPANIMLENGIERVRITDFGLARAVDDVSVTQSGVVAGTPQYMAPEQARGEPVDQRADLFALGSTLYFMCTGRPPFRGEHGMAVIRQVSDTEPTPIRSLNPDIPVWLEGIIRKLHAKHPEQRFQSAAEVAGLLEQCLAHVQQPDRQRLPWLAKELGRLMPKPKPTRPFRRHLLAGGTAVFSVACAAALLFWLRPGNEQKTGDTDDPEVPISAKFEPWPSDDQVWKNLTETQTRMSDLQHSFSPSRSTMLPQEFDLNGLSQRIETLRRNLSVSPNSGPDPFQLKIEEITRRLEALRRQEGIQ